MPHLLAGLVSVRGRTQTQRCGDLFRVGELINFFTECLAFLKIIPLAEISKQSCSKLKYSLYVSTFQISVRSFGYLKKKIEKNQGKHRMHWHYQKKSFMLDSVGFWCSLPRAVPQNCLPEPVRGQGSFCHSPQQSASSKHWKITTFPSG